ncbi:Adaptive-response sensory-kinase SasA [Paenibacillus plantiphilus]|uniref:histidine kinase n=1 Tax=Paenibacillus plantiphilus TaxID=2905650 RepID=A0ABN8GGS9_9BACL|nr:ATP-binding protein [Paenibacillus plantiphilus]CAH1208765.1 Adaptive-response sensory-kinase SasA [Paenibacillus plantiphilus]
MKLRWIIPIFWSIAASTFVLFALIMVGKLLFYSSFSSVNANLFFQWVYRNIGYPQTYIIAGIPIFLLAVYYFFKRDKRIRNEQYLVQITQHVQQIAEGDFELKIPIRNDEELGQLAGNINRFVERLNTSLNEERRAQQTKNELITNVSHDLRTPLTSITGYLGLIEQDLYRDEVELRYYVSLVYEESERMSQLIQDLFEFTRLRNNEMKLQTSRINLVEMLHQMTEQFQLQLETAKLQPRLHFPTPQLYVLGDGNKLRRVFENLITNAIKYGQDGQYLDIKGQFENGVVALDIINYGEVIPQSDLPHIFERFYRVEKSRSAHTGGSGLGLAIAKQIIELHGGAIGAFSDVERTVFSVRLKEHQT